MAAGNHALATHDTPLREKLNLGFEGNPLRVVTPEAMQGAALHENRRPDTWPIVDRESLDIEDRSVHYYLSHP